MDKVVYLDYNATTPLAPEVLSTVSEVLKDAWGNPSSGHHAGVKARQCISNAREFVGKMIDGTASDIIFTSGGTESNNMVFHSVTKFYSQCLSGSSTSLPHVIISNLEHDSIGLTVKQMVNGKLIEATIVNCNPTTGAVDPAAVIKALRPNTILISIMLANNETGVIQPIRDIVEAVRTWEKNDQSRRGVLVHTDAAQALGKIRVSATELGVDYLTIVGHKFYGPRIGALYVKGLQTKTTPIYPMLFGGGQEKGFRPGTENTGMIAGLGKAAELVVKNIDAYHDKMSEVRDYLENQLQEHFGKRVTFNGRFSTSKRIPNTSNISIIGDNLRGNYVLSNLERSQASVGAACHSHSVSKPSSILLACGIPANIAINAIRLSTGRETSKTDVDLFVVDLKNAITKLEINV